MGAAVGAARPRREEEDAEFLGVSAAWLLRFYLCGTAADHDALHGKVGSDAHLRGACGVWSEWYLESAFGRDGVTAATERGHSENRGKRAVLGYREDAMHTAFLRHQGTPIDESHVARGPDGWIEAHQDSADEPLPPSLSTAEIVSQMILPATRDSRRAYVRTKLEGKARSGVGAATHYVSHAWQSPFVCLVEAVISHQLGEMANNARKHWSIPRILAALESAPATHYYWIDAFCRDQSSPPLELAEVSRCMGSCQELVLCLHPWPHPHALLRCWVLWELAHGIAVHGIAVRVSPSHAAFRALCQQLFEADALSMEAKDLESRAAMRAQVCEQIDARHAGATVAADLPLLHGALEALPGGMDGVDGTVRAALRAQLQLLHDSFVESGGGGRRRTQARAPTPPAAAASRAPAAEADARAERAASPARAPQRAGAAPAARPSGATGSGGLDAVRARLARAFGSCCGCCRRVPYEELA